MEQPPAPANLVDSITSFQRHRNLNLPPCYRFHASDQQLLQLFLQPFAERKELKTCPIHNIPDVYSSSPEILTRAYEHDGDGIWFFLATKKYLDVPSKADRVIEGGGEWVKRGGIKNVFGIKRTQDFYAQGMDLAYWRMEEFSLRVVESNHVLAKIYAIFGVERQKLKSVSTGSTPATKKLKQDHPVVDDDITPQTLNDDDGSIPRLTAQQTETYYQPPDEDFVYPKEHERHEWMKDTFLDPRDQ